jgi:16S rRNA processing protein RimM
MILARLEGVSDRDQATALRGTRLFVLRSALPAPTEEEFYHADLIGMLAVSASGQDIGKVHAVHNFGAGDILEIRTAEGGSLDLPFTKTAVPKVDLAGGCLTVILPEDSDEDPTPGKDVGR